MFLSDKISVKTLANVVVVASHDGAPRGEPADDDDADDTGEYDNDDGGVGVKGRPLGATGTQR